MSDKQRILLVDDDGNISHLVRLYLEKEGFEVSGAARGAGFGVVFTSAASHTTGQGRKGFLRRGRSAHELRAGAGGARPRQGRGEGGPRRG